MKNNKSPCPGGLPTKLIKYALLVVLQTLEEWSRGSHISHQFTKKAIGNVNSIEDEMLHLL